MLKGEILHPEILASLAGAGHLGKVLISDGNFPHNTNPNPRAKVVWANFRPGLLDCATVMDMVATLVPIEAVEVMAPAKTGEYAMKNEPAIWADYRRILQAKSDFKGELTQHSKVKFNEQVVLNDVFLVIATGEVQLYANALITIGVVKPR